MSNDPQTAPAAPAIGISFSLGIPGERNLVFQTHVAQDTPIESMNALADRLMLVSDRVLAKYSIPALEEQITVEKAQLARIEADLTRIDEMHASTVQDAQARGRRLAPKLTEKDVQQRAQVVQMVQGYREKVGKLEAKLVELRGQVNGAHVSADS